MAPSLTFCGPCTVGSKAAAKLRPFKPRSCGRACRPVSVVNSQLPDNSKSPYSYQEPAVELPGAVWLKKGSFRPHAAFVQGDNFVMHRSGVASVPNQTATQLVPYLQPQHTSLQRMQPQDSMQLMMSTVRSNTSMAMVPVGINSCTTAMISLAAPPAAGDEEDPTDTVIVYETNNTSSPRRTHKVTSDPSAVI
jgi:hypothetical protein